MKRAGFVFLSLLVCIIAIYLAFCTGLPASSGAPASGDTHPQAQVETREESAILPAVPLPVAGLLDQDRTSEFLNLTRMWQSPDGLGRPTFRPDSPSGDPVSLGPLSEPPLLDTWTESRGPGGGGLMMLAAFPTGSGSGHSGSLLSWTPREPGMAGPPPGGGEFPVPGENPPVQPVPAPSALLLAASGAGLVRLLLRRQPR